MTTTEVEQPPVDTSVVTFEGHPIASISLRIKGMSIPTPDEGWLLGIDDRVRFVVEATVVGVLHRPDESTGKIIREQTLRIIPETVELAPWAPGLDNGILRAMPRVSAQVTEEQE